VYRAKNIDQGLRTDEQAKGVLSRINREVGSIEILMKRLFDFLSTLEFCHRLLNVAPRNSIREVAQSMNRQALISRSCHSSFAHAVRSARCGSLSDDDAIQ
jgi:hypothetical protein